MAQDNPFGDLIPNAHPSPAPAAAPQAPGVIYGRPRQLAPTNPLDEEIKRINIARGNPDLGDRNLPSLSAGYRWKNGVVGGDQEPIPGGPADIARQNAENERDKLGSEQAKAGNFYLRASRSNQNYGALGVGAEGLGLHVARAVLPDSVTNQFVGDERQQADAFMRDFIAATLRYESGAAIPPSEFESQAKTFFPIPGDSAATIEAKAQLRANAIEGLRMSAGPAADRVDAALQAPTDNAGQPPPPAGTGAGSGERWTIEQTKARYGEELYDEAGNPLGPEGGAAFDAQGNPAGLVGGRTTDTTAEDQRIAEIDAEAKRRQDGRFEGAAGLGDLLVQGGTFGLSDEAVGAASAGLRSLMGEDTSYQRERDIYRRQLEMARERNGWLGTATEFGGALLTGNPNALMSIAPQTARAALGAGARVGGGTGALAGFGYGEGAQESVGNALIGGTLGAGLGGGLAAAGPGINALRSRLPARAAPELGFTLENGARATGRDIARAGQAEGVTVNRAMVDPASRNRVTGVETTMAGGPIVQRNMRGVTDQIGDRVDSLGAGGTAMQDNVAGNLIEGASRRFIDRSGKAVGRMYDRAVQQSQGVAINPANASGSVDNAIARLSQTPETNRAEIAYLEGLKSDLSRPLGVEALRDLRTTLRKRISKGELVFGQNEARVLGIMDDLSTDIEAGLRQAGRGRAADLFRRADDLYRQRADFIENGIQKLIGRRNAGLSPERIAANFRAMASPKGDEANFARVLQTMTPDERADVTATFAEALGKNNNGEFTVDQFITQAEKMPAAARRHLFGDEGAESISNLVALSKAWKAVPRNTSRTGVSNDYRSEYKTWLLNLILGGGAGVLTSSGMTGVGAAATGIAVKSGRDILTARALMSPKITRWIRQTPRTADPRAIDTHFRRLGAIAAQEPALAGEIQAIQQRIMDVARGSLNPAAGEDVNEGGTVEVGN